MRARGRSPCKQCNTEQLSVARRSRCPRHLESALLLLALTGFGGPGPATGLLGFLSQIEEATDPELEKIKDKAQSSLS